MTRLIKFLNENFVEKFKIEDFKIIQNFIQNDCKQFLKEASKDLLLYRGFYGSNSFYKFKTNKSRNPKDNSKKFHDLLNLGFKQVFGKNLRSETVFATSDLDFSSNFGTSYIFIPCDNYKLYWSPKIKDIYDILSYDAIWFNCNNADILLGLLLLFYNQESITDKWLILSKLQIYLNKDKIKIIEAKYPNLISDNVYNTELKLNNNKIDSIYTKISALDINKIMKEFIKYFYIEGNWKDAVKSKNEIMVDCKEYYLIPYNEKYINLIFNK